jgi:hypothetical protein
MPPNFMLMSDILFRPIVETVWGTNYNTYPGIMLSNVVGYTVLVLATIPIALYFAHNMYGVGKHLGLNSLRLVGIIGLVLAAASIIVVQFVYQNALDAIAAYQADIVRGILYAVALIPLDLPVIQGWMSTSLLLASLTLAVGAGKLVFKTHLAHFIAPIILALIALIVVLAPILAMIQTPVNVILILGNNELAVLALAAATNLLGVGLGQLGRWE